MVGAIVILVAALLTAPATAKAVPARAARSCTPEVQLLPHLPGSTDSYIAAMNDRGWAVGMSGVPAIWRDGTVAPIDTGDTDIGENRFPVDVNEDGVVAINSTLAGLDAAWLTHAGDVTRLSGSRRLPAARVTGVNDHGVAIGEISTAERPILSRPVAWRDGARVLFPVPRGWRYARVYAINNHGLAVGYVRFPGANENPRPWYWRLGGRSGPLSAIDTVVGVAAVDVDDRDRILGGYDSSKGSITWDNPTAWPQPVAGSRRGASAMTNHGDVLGNTPGSHGEGVVPWVSRLRGAGEGYTLLTPTRDDGQSGWTNIWGVAIIRGVTSYAPQGGVSVAGTSFGATDYATMWTCVQPPAS